MIERLAQTGALLPMHVLLASGVSGVRAVEWSLFDRDAACLSVLLRGAEVGELLLERGWVMRQIELCIGSASWPCLTQLVRAAPDLTSEEFESIARYAETLGVSNEFLEIFRSAIEEENGLEYLADPLVVQTGIFTHRKCGLHLAEPTDVPGFYSGSHWRKAVPENPGRLEVLLNKETGALRHKKFANCSWIQNADEACLADILRVHDSSYIMALQQR